jgi:hypothetical protein
VHSCRVVDGDEDVPETAVAMLDTTYSLSPNTGRSHHSAEALCQTELSRVRLDRMTPEGKERGIGRWVPAHDYLAASA